MQCNVSEGVKDINHVASPFTKRELTKKTDGGAGSNLPVNSESTLSFVYSTIIRFET
jgi:hypothetical protein